MSAFLPRQRALLWSVASLLVSPVLVALPAAAAPGTPHRVAHQAVVPPVTAPLRPGDTGTPVATLQDALGMLAFRGVIRPFASPEHPTAVELSSLVREMSAERGVTRFGPATASLVRLFQVQQGLGDQLGGVVDARTADAINAHLRALGLLGAAAASAAVTRVPADGRIADGRIAVGVPALGRPSLLTPVRAPLSPGMSGDGVRSLQDAITALVTRQLIGTFVAPESPTVADVSALMSTMNIERTTGTFGVATQRLVSIVQRQRGLGDQRRGHVDAETARVINQLLGITQR